MLCSIAVVLCYCTLYMYLIFSISFEGLRIKETKEVYEGEVINMQILPTDLCTFCTELNYCLHVVGKVC